jgi:hypothetical protein
VTRRSLLYALRPKQTEGKHTHISAAMPPPLAHTPFPHPPCISATLELGRVHEHFADEWEGHVGSREGRHHLSSVWLDAEGVKARDLEPLGSGDETEDANLRKTACASREHQMGQMCQRICRGCSPECHRVRPATQTKCSTSPRLPLPRLHSSLPLLISASNAFSLRSGVMFLVKPNGSQRLSGTVCGKRSLNVGK